MPEIPTLVVSPRIQTSLREQFLVEPLPSFTLEERLRWDAEGLACEGMPVGRIFTIGKESFLRSCISRVYLLSWSDCGAWLFTVEFVNLRKSAALR